MQGSFFPPRDSLNIYALLLLAPVLSMCCIHIGFYFRLLRHVIATLKPPTKRRNALSHDWIWMQKRFSLIKILCIISHLLLTLLGHFEPWCRSDQQNSKMHLKIWAFLFLSIFSHRGSQSKNGLNHELGHKWLFLPKSVSASHDKLLDSWIVHCHKMLEDGISWQRAC